MVQEDLLKTLIAGGLIVGGVALVAYTLIKPEIPTEFSLILEATKGGTTNPPPDTYNYTSPRTITIQAIPQDGYEFDGWFIAGERVSTALSYDVDVSGIVLVVASFIEIGAPPLIPAYIRPVQNAVAEQWWMTWITTELVTFTLHIGIGFWNSGYAKFKICDAAGNGVAGQSIAVYTDPNPDETDFGYMYLNDAEHTSSNPLVLTSDANGVVAVKVDYYWIEPDSDYKSTIGVGGKVRYVCWPFNYDVFPIHNGHYINKPCVYEKFTRMKHPIFRNINYIHAYWVDNPNLPVWGDATADCMIKIEGDKKY